MAERPVVLVAADPVVQRLVSTALDGRGFRMSSVLEPELGPATLVDVRPDVVIVDAPVTGGEAGRAIRRMHGGQPVPVIVTCPSKSPLTAREVLDAGADDYLPRPFHPTELAARVRSLLRRRGSQLAGGTWRVGRAVVDLDSRRVLVDGHAADLARSDWRLLVRLMEAGGDVVTQDELLQAAFGPEAIGDVAALQAAIARLRRKLGAAPGDEGPIRTVRGFGYGLGGRPRA